MNALLAITLVAQLVLYAFTAVSTWAPAHRVWPPPSRQSWQFYATWFLSWVTLSGVFLLAVFGGNTLGLPLWLRLGGGLPLFLLGAFVLLWGFRALSLHTTLGLEGYFVRSGPYRWSRNPQYVGSCLYLASVVLLSGNHLAAVACVAVAGWFLAAPFIEEPWLAERFGAEYDAYLRAVPRFVGLRPLKAAI